MAWPGLAGVIVDLDGTLVDTLDDFHAALARMLADLGHGPVERAVVARSIGKGSEHLIASVLAHVGAPPDTEGAAWRAYQAAYQAVNGRHARLYPGVREGLKALAGGGLRRACLTNKPTAFAQALLQRLDLAGDFEQVFGGDAFERKKPDPLPVLRTCAALGCEPARVLVVGDSSNDAAAARAAGCPVILVTYGYNHGDPVRGVDADAFVDSMAELPAAWQQVCARRAA